MLTETRGDPTGATTIGTLAVGTAVAGVVVLGVVLRMWLLAHDPIDADQAVVGLMARSIDHGHFPVFYWGQAYGGVEPYVTAVLVAIAGLHPWVVNATPAVLALLASVVAWRLGLAISRRHAVGVVAGALMWVWSEVDVWNSTREYGFRGVVLVCSLLVLLAVVRLRHDDRSAGNWILFGAATALGWWASPEILYVALPAFVVVSIMVVDALKRRDATAVRPVVAGTAVGIVVLVPWLVATVHDHFASITVAGVDTGAGNASYLGRLQIFFVHTMPMVLGARLQVTGDWVGGAAVGETLLAVTLVGAGIGLAVAAMQLPDARLAVGVVLAYPFIEALMGPTYYWQDARYGIYLPPIALVAAVAGWDRLLGGASARGRRRTHRTATSPATSPPTWRRGVAAVLACALASASSVIGLEEATTVPGIHATSGFAASPAVLVGHPDGIVRSIERALLARRLDDVYADYWVAYDLDLFAPGRIAASPPDAVRSAALARTVAHARHSAWLFVGPTAADVDDCAVQFQNPSPEPLGLTEAQFEQLLSTSAIGATAVAVGPMVAVVPAIAVSPQWVLAHLRSPA